MILGCIETYLLLPDDLYLVFTLLDLLLQGARFDQFLVQIVLSSLDLLHRFLTGQLLALWCLSTAQILNFLIPLLELFIKFSSLLFELFHV